MAQHISLFKNDIYSNIKESIIKRFSKRNIGLGSLRYIELKDIDYKITPNDKVFINKRMINKEEEIFEVHFDIKERKIIEIFWVK